MIVEQNATHFSAANIHILEKINDDIISNNLLLNCISNSQTENE